MASWSAHTSPEIVRRRAGGRNRYNARRRTVSILRRLWIARWIRAHGGLPRGSQAAIARELKVTGGTVSRDVKALLFSGTICEECGTLHSPKLKVEPIRTGNRKAQVKYLAAKDPEVECC
jgi:hypothetical protein